MTVCYLLDTLYILQSRNQETPLLTIDDSTQVLSSLHRGLNRGGVEKFRLTRFCDRHEVQYLVITDYFQYFILHRINLHNKILDRTVYDRVMSMLAEPPALYRALKFNHQVWRACCSANRYLYLPIIANIAILNLKVILLPSSVEREPNKGN